MDDEKKALLRKHGASKIFILMLPLLVLFVLVYGDRNLEEIIIKKAVEKKAMELVKNLLKSDMSI